MILVIAGILAVIAATLAFLLVTKLSQRSPHPASASTVTNAAPPQLEAPLRFAGSQSCADCHAEEFKRWAGSHHALAEKNFTVAETGITSTGIQHASQHSAIVVTNGQLELVTLDRNDVRTSFPLVRMLGVDPLQQFLVRGPGGRFQVTELAFDPKRRDWFDVYGNEDRVPGEWGHWTGRGMNWNSMCATCHNTDFRKNYDATDDTYSSTMAEMGVGCEACHGAMSRHLDWQRAHPNQKKDPTIVRFSRDQYRDACGSCHARRSDLTGAFRAGDKFFDHFTVAMADETDTFYPDGQIRDEDYEFTSFLGSKMHEAGVRCFDCHDPHLGKPKLAGNQLCLMCHNGSMTNAPKIDAVAHGFHKVGTPGGACTDCHMPQTVYMARHWRHDHGFTIPDPQLTKEFGIPNACNRCHKDKSTEWAAEYVEKWYGLKMERPSRNRARLLAEAHRGERDLSGELVNFLRQEPNPLWRAAIVGFLRPWASKPDVTTALLGYTSDTSPIVRGAVIRALEPLAVQNSAPVIMALGELLKDPVRNVRIGAALVQHAAVETNSPAGADLLGYLNFNCDQPVGALQLGGFHFEQGRHEQAMPWLERAVTWDRNSAPLRHEYAVALSAAGRAEDAVRELKEACRLAPKEAEYRFKLALALNEANRPNEATEALKQAVEIDPKFARAWYNLGLAYAGAEQLQKALESLEKAELLDGTSADIPYARATVLARMGSNKEARAAADRALELRPAFQAAIELRQSLERN